MENNVNHIAIESRLIKCKNIITLGVKPNLSDYCQKDQELIHRSKKIYYPTTFYVDIFDAMGKKIFPSSHTYRFAQNKIKQTALFNLVNIPHPRTRFFYGKHRKKLITSYFTFPFIAKIPKGSAMGRGVFLIKNNDDLNSYCELTHVAYIQEYLASDRDIRVVVIGKKVAHAYWRIAQPGEYRSNLAAGASISLEPVPKAVTDLALYTAKKCRWNDVGIDIIKNNEAFFVLEANMKYGKEGFRKAGIDYIAMMEKMVENGEI